MQHRGETLCICVCTRYCPVAGFPFSIWLIMLKCCCVPSSLRSVDSFCIYGSLYLLFWCLHRFKKYFFFNPVTALAMENSYQVTESLWSQNEWVRQKVRERERDKWGFKLNPQQVMVICWRWFSHKGPHDMNYCHMTGVWSVIQIE